jgi:hypothetical protein
MRHRIAVSFAGACALVLACSSGSDSPESPPAVAPPVGVGGTAGTGGSGGAAGTGGSGGAAGTGGATFGANGGSAPDAAAFDSSTVSDAGFDRTDSEPQAPEASVADGARPVKNWDWNGIVGTGQSLSVGAQASQATLTTQPFKNLKLSLGSLKLTVPPYNADDPALSVAPLVEPIRAEATTYPSAYPLNIYGETPHTAMGSQISDLYQRDAGGEYATVHTVVGENGQPMRTINKSATPTATLGHAYAATLFEATALTRLAKAAGKTYGVAAIILTHGESDAGSTAYGADMYQLYKDYNTDISAITGQKTPMILITTQQQTSPGDNTTTASLVAEWKAGVDHPTEIVCAGPKYQYEYAADHLHLVARGYDQLGEKYGEVYYERVVLGRAWRPLEPLSAVRSATVITVSFHVPVPPLAWDSRVPAPHQTTHAGWAKGRGFEVADDTGEIAIDQVAIAGDSVAITLAKEPMGKNLVVRYALTQDGSGNNGGLAIGRIGQLRDSDPLVGTSTKLPQYNFAVSFTMPVN